MNKTKEDFAHKMLTEALESVRLPSGRYGALRFGGLLDPDEIIWVVYDSRGEVATADCKVWDVGNNICGSILLEVARTREALNFSYKNGKLSAGEVFGNA